MGKILVFSLVLFVAGCVSPVMKSGQTVISPIELNHESTEIDLLTEAEFMDRVTQSATKIYEGMVAINDAVNLYALDNNGNLPLEGQISVESQLLDGGYIQEWPVVPAFAYTDPGSHEFDRFTYRSAYDDLDGLGEPDPAINVQKLKIEVCQDFIRRYASPGFGQEIYDFEAAEGKYPGETIGRHVKIYAVTWEKSRFPDYCEILWVVKYNVPPLPSPARQ